MVRIGEVNKWSDVVKEYPKMSVIVTDVERDFKGDIDTCKVMEVVPFENETETVAKWLKGDRRFGCYRTYYPDYIFGGPLCFLR